LAVFSTAFLAFTILGSHTVSNDGIGWSSWLFTACAMLRPAYMPRRGVRHLWRAARNIMECSPTCEEDPAWPGLFTLINKLKMARNALFPG
jgi:hypothetical protein